MTANDFLFLTAPVACVPCFLGKHDSFPKGHILDTLRRITWSKQVDRIVEKVHQSRRMTQGAGVPTKRMFVCKSTHLLRVAQTSGEAALNF